jgi:AcrR family transcriptional regulator
MAHPQAISDDSIPAADPATDTQAEETPSPLESLPSASEAAPLPLESSPLPLEATDPRVRRTRQLLQQALADLLHLREFDKLSVQEITDAAGLNRATFYAHYPDKFALLECMVASRFHALLDRRGVVFDGTCTNALTGIVLGVCDFLAQTLSQLANTPCGATGQMPPHMESAIVAVVRGMLLDGIRNHPPATPTSPAASPELLASTASWAIYGAAKEWSRTPNRAPSEEIAATIQGLILPILHPQSA